MKRFNIRAFCTVALFLWALVLAILSLGCIMIYNDPRWFAGLFLAALLGAASAGVHAT